MNMEVFFDAGTILIELHDIEFSGDAKIHDPKSSANEKVEFSGPLSVMRITLVNGMNTAETGQTIPSLEVMDVDFKINPKEIVVSTFGDLPLYKAHKFEDSIKNTLVKNSESIKKDFRAALQKAENHMWTRFPWDDQPIPKVHVETNLSENIDITEEFMEFDFQSDVKGVDQQHFPKPLRYIEPEFDQTSDMDVQITLDENYINHIFAYMYHSDTIYGLRSMLMDNLFTDDSPIKNFLPIFEQGLTKLLLTNYIPGLSKAFPKAKNVDIRCDFRDDHLNAVLNNVDANEIRFLEGNKVEYDIASSCGVWVNEKYLIAEPVWKPFKTVFFHATGNWEL